MEISEIVSDLLGNLEEQLGDDIGTIRTFASSQGKKLAAQAKLIAEQRVAGVLRDDDELFEHFVQSLKDAAENFARSVVMLTVLTIEKAWNAIVNAIWGALNGILQGAGLPSVFIPGPPSVN
ncbi:MAG: hypothetical protein AAGE05_05990 [Pseudomonadota bacterium]